MEKWEDRKTEKMSARSGNTFGKKVADLKWMGVLKKKSGKQQRKPRFTLAIAKIHFGYSALEENK